ncbi:hypothetical protein B0A50_06559 [Salinomyces thailandicus]|uniref:Fermentation associated protein n=1 Tax=Salinomyces thailandicus TaxID=706561 RepID=A0A4U0TRQ9_9PEZI|nr:hypothetical protein B0A50_06559 [Salinomyces thailandica]
MASTNDLTASPLASSGGFNWVYLVDILVCGILALFFLFYFNRLFATLISYAVRAWTWHKYRAYIDISSLQFSLLGGRIFFKSIRYHAHNETVLVHDGHITWRYWIRSVQEAEIFEVEDEGARKGKERSASGSRDRSKSTRTNSTPPDSPQQSEKRSKSPGKAEKAGGKKKELPCRISVVVSGVEAFIYNRSPAYDMIIDAANQQMKPSPTSTGGTNKSRNNEGPPSSSSQENEKMSKGMGSAAEKMETNDSKDSAAQQTYHRPEIPAWLRMLPVKVECKRAAAAIGNEHTTSVITAKVEKAAGTIDAAQAGSLDLFKLLFNFEFEKVIVQMKPNRDFKQLQLDFGRSVLREKEVEEPERRYFGRRTVKKFDRGWQTIAGKFQYRRSPTGSLRTASMKSVNYVATAVQNQLPGQAQWYGLSRYLDEKQSDEHDEWQPIEYAKSSTLVDCPKISFKFYWDIPGQVPDGIAESDTLLSSEYAEDINGSKPPEYGLEFGVHGGSVVYGPWADRQRINMQQIFFPGSFVDAVPADPLKPGETRVCTLFKIFVSVENDVILRVPTREPSKDDQWKGRAEKSHQNPPSEDASKQSKKHGRKQKRKRQRKGNQGAPADARPYGWLDIAIKADTTVNYIMDMFSRQQGFKNFLDLDVKGTEMTSSVNHGLLWRAGPLTLDADLSYPVAWDKLRRWPFNIVCDDLELFILRDHMFLIIDIVNDWATGPPPDFWTFVPFFYDLDMTFRNFCMYLNVNDANIINDPADFDKNDFVTLEGRDLHGIIHVPLEHYRPKKSEISFEVLALDMKMRMLSPSRSPLQTLIKDKQVADLPKLTLKGSYDQNSEERPGLTDVLRFDIVGTGLNLKAHGQLVRQLINVKENYFGDYMHFKTLEEFQGAGEDLHEANANTVSVPQTAVNELDVILCIVAEQATVMLPTNLYDGETYIRVELPLANLDLRILSYYLDMGLNLSPLSLLSGSTAGDGSSPVEEDSGTQLYVNHVDLYGHRAFGLPPVEPAYFNTWDIDVGAFTGECSSEFTHDLALALRAFAFAFEDAENALPVSSPNVFNDVSFVHVRTDIIRIWLHFGNDALLFAAEPISVDTNDWAGNRFSQRITVLAPQITLACIDAKTASRKRVKSGQKTLAHAFAFLQTGAAVDIVIRKKDFENQRQAQQAHLRQSDRRTGRVPFLLRGPHDLPSDYVEEGEVRPPAATYPTFPYPITRSGRLTHRPKSIKSVRSFVSGRSLGSRKSSSSIATSIQAATAAPDVHQPVFRSIRRQTSHASSVSNSDESSHHQSRDENERSRAGLPPSTMAFSSQFAEPYFPLHQIEPNESNVPSYASDPRDSRRGKSSSSISEEIVDPELEQDAEHVSVMINIEPGIRAYVEPEMASLATKLLGKILPKTLEDVMDAFHMSVMGTIAAHQQARNGTASILEIHATLQSALLRVVNPDLENGEHDQLDIEVHGLDQMVRIRQHPGNQTAKQNLALRTSVDTVEIALGSRTQLAEHRSAIKARADDALVWIAVSNTQSIHASVRDTELIVAGAEAPYLARLALRLAPMIDDMTSQVTSVLDKDRKKLLLLIYTLTQNSEDIGDPQHVSRMTYILRAFPDHFRNQDSWKVLSRFRHVLRSLPDDVKDDLAARYKAGDLDCPCDASTQVLESWAQWRNWDIPNVNQTLVFRMLFSQVEEKPLEEPEVLPLALTVRSVALRLAVQHGSKQNEILIEEAALGLDRLPPTTPTGLMLADENTRTKTALQLHTSSIGLDFDWSLFTIAEAVLPFKNDFERLAHLQPARPSRTATELIGDELSRHDFHIAFSTDNSTVSLQTINLQHKGRTEGLKMSLVGTTHATEKYGQCANALINVDKAVTELYLSSTCIYQTLMTSPTLYIDHLQPIEDGVVAPAVVVAGAYEELNIAVKEQLPGIIHIADNIITDEAAKITRLIKSLQTEKTVPSKHSEDATNGIPPVQLELAMLAGDLHLEISLLQSLSYRCDGRGASFRLAPNFHGEKAFGVDFDIGRQDHGFVNLSKNERHGQVLLQLPPINGHVSFTATSEETSLSVATTVERIDIDAAAIQGVMSVLNKPEVQQAFSEVSHTVEDMKHHVCDLGLQSQHEQKLPTSGKQTLYDVRFALLGIRVAASTPQVKGRSTAEVEFGIGPVHATASNRALVSANQLIPEVRAQIQDIGAKLWIEDRGRQQPCGNAGLGLKLHFSSHTEESGAVARELQIVSDSIEIDAFPETASTVVDVINHLQDRLRDLDMSREVEYLRRLRDSRKKRVIKRIKGERQKDGENTPAFTAADLLSVKTTVTLSSIQICWLVSDRFATSKQAKVEDAVLTLSSIEFTTRGGNEARLTLREVLLQLTKKELSMKRRSLNSALLPEVGFSVAYWSHDKNRSLAFKATGQALDLRLESRFIVPVNAVQKSVEYAVETFKTGTANWQNIPTSSGAPRAQMVDTKRIVAVLVEADFAGAQVYMQGGSSGKQTLGSLATTSRPRGSQHGRYGQFNTGDEPTNFTLRAPGIALKVEYNSLEHRPTLNGELRVDASTNTLKPNVVPLFLEVFRSVKEVMQHGEGGNEKKQQTETGHRSSQKYFEEDSIVKADPSTLFGKTKVDLGLRICRQEFGLSCQPIARVDAKAALDDLYFTMNTVESDDYGHFFAMSAVLSKISAQVKHVYSREPTFSFDMEAIVLSAMNSKHLDGVNGVSAILKVNPTQLSVNAKQLQDLLLFREIWLPPEIRNPQSSASSSNRPDDYVVQKYQSVAAAAAFPWNATVSIAKLSVDLDLGQSIGKTSFNITSLWASQQKSSSWEQDLCLGLGEMDMTSTGRMSGFVRLVGVGVRTSIEFPQDTKTEGKTPLVQASIGFQKLRAKAAFDYQAFAFGDIEDFDFLMYNVRAGSGADTGDRDRLVAVVDCGKAYVFCTATSPAQAVGLYQAFNRLIHDKQTAYMQALRDIEKHMRRESTVVPTRFGPQIPNFPAKSKTRNKSPISLHTDVVLTLGAMSFGVYPSTFLDNQLLKLEANNIQARFAVGLERGKIHCGLGMTLGQLQVALASVRRLTVAPRALEVSVEDVINAATNAKGGTILRVPKVIASMQTWQASDSNSVDFIFKSLFEGKIDVGWNLSRINFIKGMYVAHTRSLASRLGKSLPHSSAVKITASDQRESTEGAKRDSQERITAEVNLPQSKYEYRALEPPIIETPQLRDMGEATPPLEWVGLDRNRLPHVTHQIVIVSLLEMAREVEDAYESILGSS